MSGDRREQIYVFKDTSDIWEEEDERKGRRNPQKPISLEGNNLLIILNFENSCSKSSGNILYQVFWGTDCARKPNGLRKSHTLGARRDQDSPGLLNSFRPYPTPAQSHSSACQMDGQ